LTSVLNLALSKLYRRHPLTSYGKVQALISAVTRNRKTFAKLIRDSESRQIESLYVEAI